MNLKNVFTPIFVFFSCFNAFAQDSLYHFFVEAQGSVSGKQGTPFWFRSNQFGSVPLAGTSGSFLAGGYKEYEDDYHKGAKLFDWGAGFQGRVNAGDRSQFILVEVYAKLRLAMFQLKAGRTKDVTGLNGDTLLSSGNFAVSGNALGIPKIDISIPNYYRLPVLGGLFSIKGNIAHGWVGKVPFRENQFIDPDYPYKPEGISTYFHQISLYVRIGKEDWKANIYAGINHEAYWGSENVIYGRYFNLSPLSTFFHVFTGQRYKYGGGVGYSKIGNQLGSVDLGFEYQFDQLKMLIYRQNIYDVGALARLANLRDGLNGITLTNLAYNKDKGKKVQWKSLLFEFLYTKNQAGERWSKPTQSGDENYYNNAYYPEGWSYNGVGIGTPLITPEHLAREGQAKSSSRYFINNRVIAFHSGISAAYQDWSMIGKLSYSRNFGTFATTTGASSGDGFFDPVGHFIPVNQFSGYLEINKEFRKQGLVLGGAIAVDRGRLLDNNMGGLLKIAKYFVY